MANDLATLSTKLSTALRVTAHDTWDATEVNDLVTWAVDGLYPRYARTLDPESDTIALVDEQYFYDLPAGVVEVSTVETYDDSNEYGAMDGQAWSVVGDPEAGSGKLHIAPVFASTGDTARLYGDGKNNVETNLIPDTLVPLVIARARAEAYRREAARRANFQQWQATEQTQNVSVNELVLLINEADADANQLSGRLQRTWRRPVPGRLG